MTAPETTICCPDEPRRTGLVTACGLPVEDVHRHKGMLRGFVIEPGQAGTVKRKLHWHKNGRLTPTAAMDYDLRRAG